MKEYNEKLKNEHNCDLVLPLCHLYEYQDEKTCREFNFPVILSGHDHHRVDRVVNGTRLLKPGMDANYAVILDLIWESSKSESVPTITASTVYVPDFLPDAELQHEAAKAYSILNSLSNTHLSTIPEKFFPLTSKGVLEKRVSMATYLCTQLRLALNLDTKNYGNDCDCVMIRGGKFRGERDYSEPIFTLESLKTEFTKDEGVYVWSVPGHILQQSVQETWARPNSAWIQCDDEVEIDSKGHIIMIGNQSFDLKKTYRVGSLANFSKNRGGTPTMGEYFRNHPEYLPDFDAGITSHVLLLKLFAQDIWKRIKDILDADGDGVISPEELKTLDIDGDKKLSKAELRSAIENLLGMASVEGQDTFLEHVLDAGGDRNLNRKISIDEMNKK